MDGWLVGNEDGRLGIFSDGATGNEGVSVNDGDDDGTLVGNNDV